MRRRIIIALIAVLVAAVPAQAAAVDPLANFYNQQLHWKKCTEHLECATFTVPLDYQNPSGRTITITAARNNAAGKARGSLVINPGGPGGSGVDYIEIATDVVTPALHREFDLVSFDPRGLRRSTPLDCFNDDQIDAFLEVDQTPDNAAEERALVASAQALISACQRSDKELMQHVSTIEVARDMDILRALLGEPRLRFLGKSWGTALGQAYAALFPLRTGLFVLDGAVDIRISMSQASFDQAQAFEIAADRFIGWCLQQGRCVLGRTEVAARSRLIGFIAKLDSQPLPTRNRKRPLTEEQAWTAVIGPMYVAQGGWDWLNIALTTAIEDRNGSELQAINDWFVERSARGRYADNGNTLIYAVNCLDRAGAVSLAQAKQQRADWAERLPLMGRLMAWGDEACASWPYRSQESLRSLRIRSVPPMLVIGTTYDPATPMKWARAVQKQIPKSVLLERMGDGHTAYTVNSPCIDKTVDAYLLSRNLAAPALPVNGKRCD